MGKTSRWLAVVVASWVSACGAADNRIDPGDLGLRDLLGISPDVALQWDGAQRAAAREVLNGGLVLEPPTADAVALALVGGRSRDERIASTLAKIDRALAGDGDDALGLVHVELDATTMTTAALIGPRAAELAAGRPGAPPEPIELWLAAAWDDVPAWATLPDRGLELMAALAVDAGHVGGPIVIAPAPRLAVVAAYVVAADAPPQLMINPVLLAALEPDGADAATVVAVVRGAATGGGVARAPSDPTRSDPDRPDPIAAGTGGNPYSFYGSVGECAFVQRTRCETCLASSSCEPVTNTTDGNAECTTLAASGGRGYFLLCANLALSITSVGDCVRDEAAACPFTSDAASNLATLEDNARFVDDAICGGGLDRCLADIFGAPPSPFPGPDGGTVPTDPPRDTSVACDNSCDDNNANCSPSCGNCDSSGPSCNNAFSCDSSCSSSNEQSGCGGNCEACDSDSNSGGSTSAGCGGCDSDGASSDSGGSCDSCSSDSSDGGGSCGGDSCSSDSSSGGGGSCDSCSSDSSGGGGSCGGDSCSGGDSGGGGCGGGGGGGNSCNVAKRTPPPGASLAITLVWALLPIPAAALLRRRSKRRKATDAEVGA